MKKAGRPKEFIYPTIVLNNRTLQTLCETLFRKGVVSIPRLGVFKIKAIKARKTYHNFSKKKIVIPAHSRVHFEPSVYLKKLCQSIKK